MTTDRSVGKDTCVKQPFFVFALCLVSSVSCASKVRDVALVQSNLAPDWSLYDIVGDFNEYGIAAVVGDSGWAYVDTLGRTVVVSLYRGRVGVYRRTGQRGDPVKTRC